MNSKNVHYSFHILGHFMHIYSDKKFMHRLFTVLFLVKKRVENVMQHTSQDISFCNTHHCQILQGTIWSSYGYLVVSCTIGVENSNLGTDMFSVRNVMDPVDHEDMLQVSLSGAAQILMWCVITLAVITQLHLWHLYLQVTVCGWPAFTRAIGVTFSVSQRCHFNCCNISILMMPTRIT
jgi:hypothetical protein